MRRLAASLAVLCALCVGTVWAARALPAWFSQQNDLGALMSADKPLLIWVHQDGCHFCDIQLQEQFANPAIRSQMQTLYNTHALKLGEHTTTRSFSDGSKSEDAIARALGARFTPQSLFLVGGKVVFRLPGLRSDDEYSKALDYIASSAYTTLSYEDYLNERAFLDD